MFSGQRWEERVVLKYHLQDRMEVRGKAKRNIKTGLIMSVFLCLCVSVTGRVHNTVGLRYLKRLSSTSDKKKKNYASN